MGWRLVIMGQGPPLWDMGPIGAYYGMGADYYGMAALLLLWDGSLLRDGGLYYGIRALLWDGGLLIMGWRSPLWDVGLIMGWRPAYYYGMVPCLLWDGGLLSIMGWGPPLWDMGPIGPCCGMWGSPGALLWDGSLLLWDGGLLIMGLIMAPSFQGV